MYNVTNNSSVSAKSSFRYSARLFRLICGTIIIIVGTIGNLLVVATFCKNKKLRREHGSKFILNLALADVLFCLLAIPGDILMENSYYWTKDYDLRNQICKAIGPIFFWTFFVSLISMTMVSINRLVLIVFNSKYRMIYNKYTVLAMVAFSWLFSLALALVPHFKIWGQYRLSPNKRSLCGTVKLNGTTPVPLYFILGFSIPTLSMLVTYGLIWYKVVQQGNTFRTNKAVARNFKLFKLILIIFGTFVVCYLPNVLARFIMTLQVPRFIKDIIFLLVWTNSCINPLIYFYFNRNYRTALEKMIGFRFCRPAVERQTSSLDTTESGVSNDGRPSVRMTTMNNNMD